MEVIQIRGKSEPLNGAFDVFSDVGGLVGDGHLRSGHVVGTPLGRNDAALGCHCGKLIRCQHADRKERVRPERTEDLAANIVFADEIPKEFLVYSGPVDSLLMSVQYLWIGVQAYCRVPKCASKLKGFK